MPPSTGAASLLPRPTDEGGVPVALVGSWVSSDTARTALVKYTFTASTFESLEVIVYPEPQGNLEIRVMQNGGAAVDGDQLTLTPITATTSVHDPEHPEDSYADRPAELVPRTYSWHIIDSALLLRTHTGAEITLKRQT
jgi:hypothetical protein